MTKEKKTKVVRPVIKILVLLLMVAIIAVSVLYALKSETVTSFKWEELQPSKILDDLMKEQELENKGSFFLSSFDVMDTQIYMGDLLILSANDIRLLNDKGEENWYSAHEIRQPVLRIKDKTALVYEQSGKSYIVIRDKKIIHRGTLEEEISFGCITKDYILFISSSEIGYKRTIHAISADNGIKLGALYIDDYYPYYAKEIQRDGRNAIVLYGLGMNSTRISTIIRLYDSTLIASPISSTDIDGLYPILHENAGKRLFVGETGSYCYNDDMDLIWSGELQTGITAAGLFDNGGMIFGRSGDSNALVFYSQDGKEIKKIPVENTIESIVVFKNTAAVVSGSEASFYTASGNLIDRTIMAGMSVKVHFTGEKDVYLVSEHEAIHHTISSKNLHNP